METDSDRIKAEATQRHLPPPPPGWPIVHPTQSNHHRHYLWARNAREGAIEDQDHDHDHLDRADQIHTKRNNNNNSPPFSPSLLRVRRTGAPTTHRQPPPAEEPVDGSR